MKTYSRKKTDDLPEVIIHLNELCRLCMSKEEELVPIFNDDDAIPLTLRIMACVSLEVFEEDGLPSMICHPCRYQLEKSYAFKKKCEQSDLKLRQHLKHLREKMGTETVHSDESDTKDTKAEDVSNLLEELMGEDGKEDAEEETEEVPETEQDLLGVAQVAYIQPDTEQPDEEEAPEHITLPMETERTNKEACTLTNMQLKKEVIDEQDDEQEQDEDDEEEEEEDEEERDEEQQQEGDDSNLYAIDQEQGEETVIDEQDLDAIANAVKATLSSHPGLNTSGDLQMKINQVPGQPTQVHVTTEDGSVVVIELVTEEEPVRLNDPNNEDDELKVFQCPECPKAFSRRIQLRRHSSVHMQQRGFSCGICEKWFPTRSALIRHERIHTGERPFQCDVCQKSFAQKEILYRHLMTHTGQKPYNCTRCPKGFTQKEPLRIHMRSHLNPSPTDIQLHHCTLCPKVFCHASGLSRHLVTHTGKTFKCRGCDKSFTDKSSLRRHHRQTMHQ